MIILIKIFIEYSQKSINKLKYSTLLFPLRLILVFMISFIFQRDKSFEEHLRSIRDEY